MTEPVIVIAGREWCVPFLAPRQNHIVVPALMRLGMCRDEQYDLLLDIVFAALTRAYPEIVRDDFDDWPVTTHELIDALPVIAEQTGLMQSGAAPVRPPRHDPPDWDAIIAEVVNFLPGTTPDYWEDALTVPRLEALREQWRLHPPPALLLAAFLGYRPRPRDDDVVTELLRLFPTGTLKRN
jgi:hypothetical protein